MIVVSTWSSFCANGNPATSSTSSSAHRFGGTQTSPDEMMSDTEFRRAILLFGLLAVPRTGVYSCTMTPARLIS